MISLLANSKNTELRVNEKTPINTAVKGCFKDIHSLVTSQEKKNCLELNSIVLNFTGLRQFLCNITLYKECGNEFIFAEIQIKQDVKAYVEGHEK